MNVLSLFDGMSCGRIALERAKIPVSNYFSSEIDRYAMGVSAYNYPDIIQIGDVCKIDVSNLPKIDLIIAGSPCQGFSFAGNQLNFADSRSVLFFEFVRIYEEIKKNNPNVKFLLENVKMKKEYQDKISEILKIQPILIDSADFTACHRRRLYWTDIPILNWNKQDLYIKDVILGHENHLIDITDRYNKKIKGSLSYYKSRSQTVSVNSKHRCLTTTGQNISNSGATNIKIKNKIFKIDAFLSEKMQGVPENYTFGVSETQRQKMLGNGWTIDVIVHIFKGMKEKNNYKSINFENCYDFELF